MAQDSWPSPAHNDRQVTDPEYEKITARFSDDGVWGDPGDPAVVSAGVGLQAVVRADVYASLRGHAWYSGTSDVTLAIAANSSGQTRTDRVVLRLDRSTWTVRAVVKQGTPGAGAPALTQSTGDVGVYEIPLARVTVPHSASSVTVTREELYIGSRIRPCTSSTRPVNAARGDVAYETDTGRWIAYNGTSWAVIYEDTGDITLGPGFSSWRPFSPNIGRRVGNVVSLRLSVERRESTLTTTDPDGSKIGSMPAILRPRRYEFTAGRVTSTGGVVRVEARPDGEIWVRYPTENITVGRVLESTITYLV